VEAREHRLFEAALRAKPSESHNVLTGQAFDNGINNQLAAVRTTAGDDASLILAG